jgi:hypothetical protein
MAAALAFAVLAGAVWWVSTRLGGALQLPDGREVTVRAVTYGTNHTLIEGPLWTKAIRRFVSRPKAHQLGLRIYENKSDEPTLIVWTHWRLPSTNEAPHYASLRDRHGVESEPAQVAIDAPVGKTGTAIMAWQFANFPRHQRDFQFRFYQRESGRLRLLGEVAVPNAHPVTASTSTAASPPVTTKQDDIEFSVTMLRSGGEVATNLIRPYVQVAPWTEARFAVRERGQLATNWTVRKLRITSESGNRLNPPSSAVPSTNGDYRVAFPDALWPDEAGWKIRGEFARGSGFVETNRWTMRSIPAIRNTSAFTTNLSQELNGLRIDQVGLRPSTQFIPYVRGGFRRTTDLTVDYAPNTDRLHIALVGATDNNERPLRFSGGSEPMKNRYVVGLEMPTNSTTVSLTFVVHEGREVEFFVKPDWVTTNAVPR